MDQVYLAADALVHFLREHIDAIGGSFVSFLVAQDYNWGRFVAGLASGLFMAIYFTDWLLHYLPIPPDMSINDAHTIAGALWGLTGYIVVSTLLIFAQQKTTEYLGKAAEDAQTKGGQG